MTDKEKAKEEAEIGWYRRGMRLRDRSRQECYEKGFLDGLDSRKRLSASSGAPADDPAPDMVEKAREFAAQGDHGVDEYWLATKLADFAVSIHADLIRENGELKEKVEYFGKLADEMTALAKRNRQLEAKILAARKQLKSDHIQDNKHRLGLLGSQDIDRVYTALEDK